MCARPDCVTQKTLPPLSLHDPEPANWSLVCSTQASKVPAKAFKSRRVVQFLSVKVQWCPPSCRADGTDGDCLVAGNELIRESKLLDSVGTPDNTAFYHARCVQIRVQLQRKTDMIKCFFLNPTATFKRRVDKTRFLPPSVASLILRDMSMQTLRSVNEGAGRITSCVRIRKMIGITAHTPKHAPPTVWLAAHVK